MERNQALLDLSVDYLKRSGLESIISKALIQVINERARDPQRRLCELLDPDLASSKGQLVAAARKDSMLDANVELEEANAKLSVEKAELQESNATLTASIADLHARNASLDRRARELEENLRKKESVLMAENNELKATVAKLKQAKAAPSASPPSHSTAQPVPQDKNGNLTAQTAVKLAKTMGALFNMLDVSKQGELPRTRVLAFTSSLAQGCEASDSDQERRAMRAFSTILEKMVEARAKVSQSEFHSYITEARNGGGYTSTDAETFISILTTILDIPEAVEGLLETIEELEHELTEQVAVAAAADGKGNGSPADGGATIFATTQYKSMMRRMFDEVLDVAEKRGAVTPTNLLDCGNALRRGVESSEDEDEKAAMLAFVELIESAVTNRHQVTREQWLAHFPTPGSCSEEDGQRFVAILTDLLNNDEAREGLIEVIASMS